MGYPFMAFAGTCGASLIASNVILTSARCDDITEVNIGRWKLNDNSEVYETFNIIQKVAHPNFDPTTYDNDFMVAQLDGHSTATPVEIDDGTQDVPKNTKIVIMGWGTNQENGTDGVNKLKDTTIKKKTKDVCRNVYGSQVTSNNFCAKKNNKGVCTDSRDIGGPAIHKETGVQVGIISFSKEGKCTGQPVMLSKISAKYTWIMEQVDAMKVTPAPVAPAPVTPAPVTSAPVTSAPVTPAPVTPAPVTPAPATSAPVNPAPVTSVPTPSPSDGPSLVPTASPSEGPSLVPTASPSEGPSLVPTASPSDGPTKAPSLPPVGAVTPAPVTSAPIPSPSDGPSLAPTTRAQVVIPVAISKLQSAVDIIEDEL